MTDTLTDAPALPQPRLARWQPLRLGLVELFHYDSEEFWFKDGHLLLRGNNGTGKSKVLSLTLPFLFDAQLKSSRIEPDGDAGKKMAWNLLLGRHDRRMGYTWIEFGRVDEAGQPHYLTLGCGLSAAAARPQVDSWFFVQEGARVGQDFWLIGPSRVVLTRERLRDTLAPLGGQLFDTAAAYRRAVDERLFHLGAVRYGALMDTLIQLRQPQLSKKPDEANLSNALSEALPPMSTDLLGDVADALNELETYRRELDEYEALARAVGQFNQRYQVYAATQARRQARGLRSAQTGFDNASRELNEGRAALAVAQADEAEATQAQADAERQLQASRVRLEELLNDPANNAARQLDLAERDASRRQSEAQQALRAQADTQARLSREQQASRERGQRAAQAGTALERTRADTQAGAQRSGLAPACAANPLLVADVASLAPAALDAARHELRQSLAQRREHVTLLLRRCREAEEAAQARARQQALRDERQDEAEAAAAAREEADTAAQAQAEALVDAWQACLADLRQLQVAGDEAVLDALASWAASLQGDNPARTALHAAQQAASLRLAERQAALNTEQQRIDDAQALLQAERTRLERGEDATPPPPHWRAAEARATTNQRAGAPLWQLLDFHPQTDPAQHAGLEAALQAAGLLDAWVTPDGLLHRADGTALLHDAQWLARPRQPWSLAAWLQPAELPDHAAAVPAATVQALLEGVGCGPHDDGTAEAWIQPDGRFRLGALAGAWSKPAADFIGYAARAAARARRLQQIAAELAVLAQARAQCAQDQQRLAQDRQQAEAEWRSAPADDALRAAHADAAACARAFQAARERLDQAERQLQAATAQRDAARQALVRDAEDLQLPPEREPLHAIEAALQSFADTLHALAHAALALRDALHEHGLQQQREHDALADADQAAAHAAEREAQAEEARIRLQTLRESVGAKVEELQARLRVARDSVDHSQQHTKGCEMALREAGEARARAGQKTQDADAVLAERSATRQQAVAHLQGFAATGLLATALPAADIPPQQPPWTIEAALTLARSSEQALSHVKDDDEAWTRVQSLVSQDYTELGRALAALSHQAQAETHDYGLVVSIVYQNRPERPDQLGARLAAEIAQRRELLTAGERQVLENHLQAEIAAAVRRLLLDAERQVDSINTELAKRPTSTGVRFRLQWQPLPEGADGAPVGLEAARKRLLNTSTDLWTAEDRRVVGEMLQQRIAAERARADAGLGGSLLEQLARALDYRRWHRFRVQRWQDGQWRPLSGPASSGERALGLTVPLFAAVSSYYSQDGATLAPRLVLLDEAFAGIDDAARAHCMGLVREFDLDFVITSEREWACYAELPGVAIAQLQRREGVDAVHVSRWTWDGRAAARGRSGPALPGRGLTVDARLQRLLGGEALAPLRQRLRRHFERHDDGHAGAVLQLAQLDAAEHAALAQLMGRPSRPARSARVDVAAIDAALQAAGIAASLRAALEQLDGPITSRSAQQTAHAAAWATVTGAPGLHPMLRDWLQASQATALLKRLARQDTASATALLAQADAVLQRLPVRGMPRAQLAATVLGNAHALDAGRPVASLVLAVWRQAGPADEADDEADPERSRDTWARAGVLVNELARPALVLNLPGFGTPGEPAYLSLRQLVRNPPRWNVASLAVSVCENPNLLAIAADQLGAGCAPLVCTDGMPAAAQRTLLGQLVQAGARLQVHADFDWPGLRIANHVLRSWPAQAWRMGADDYLAAARTAPHAGRDLPDAGAVATWDAALAPAMQSCGLAIAEEALAERLLQDLRCG